MATLEKIQQVTGRGVSVPGDDVDTDRIIPARFMKCITFDGLGEYAFYDVRKNEDGTLKEHPLNKPEHAGAEVLIVGRNFGCGSSREHAPQSLYRYGFRAIVGESFAEIFFGNSTTLGMPCVMVPHADRRELAAMTEAAPQTVIQIDLKAKELRAGEKRFAFDIDETARQSLLEGRWDNIATLLEEPEAIDETARRLAYV